MISWRSQKAVRLDIADHPTIPMPGQVETWLSKQALLGEVPFSYLVPDERELPIESIRFFCVDPMWTKALIAGASSIGGSSKYEFTVPLNELRDMQPRVKTRIRLSRFDKMHRNHLRKNSLKRASVDTTLTGFIMRSDLVSHWNGIEVKGFNGEEEIDLLRMEKLSEKILIGIFEGEIDSVRMYEPKEVLHFGTRSQSKKILVKRIDEGHEGEPVKDEHGNVEITVPYEDNGRININELRATIASVLDVDKKEIESPQLALEMLSVADQCYFKREENH